MSLANRLVLLRTRGAYLDQGSVVRRWGQLLRESPEVSGILQQAESSGTLVPLHTLGRLHSGVVTRANAYFIGRELPFDQIPARFRLTRRDLRRVTVVMDGLETPHRIERRFLRKLVKGPEALMSPLSVEETTERLFDVDSDKGSLRSNGHTGALDYLRRGETVSYKTSEDRLKGGIPAQRSQIKNRKPHWYSLNVPAVHGPRLLLPEHLDRRYIVTLLDASDDRVVIDTLYTFEPDNDEDAPILVAALNSLLTWYQLEVRGRTQHGEGVLKVKIPDWGGILVANPAALSGRAKARLIDAFGPLSEAAIADSLAEVSDPTRLNFDVTYLRLLGIEEPEAVRLLLERELRAVAAERLERKASVAEAKLDRRRTTSVSATVDAYASRLASSLEPFPDPRRVVPDEAPLVTIPITGPAVGSVTIGTELFNQGEVIANDLCIAHAGDVLSSQFVRAVLLHDPQISHVDVPAEPVLRDVMHRWREESAAWRTRFERAANALTRGIHDARLVEEIRRRALTLLHADS
jgi:hypothetical protein